MAEGIDIIYANVILIFVAVGVVIGARLGEVVFYEWSYYRAHPRAILRIWQGGLASHGAVIGIAVMLWLYARVVVHNPSCGWQSARWPALRGPPRACGSAT